MEHRIGSFRTSDPHLASRLEVIFAEYEKHMPNGNYMIYSDAFWDIAQYKREILNEIDNWDQ